MIEPALVEKYVCAGHVARSAMFHATKLVKELEDPLKIDHLGPLVDNYINIQCSKYLPEIKDKGLAKPCELFARLSTEDSKDELVVHKISFGVQFDGHAVIFAHSILPNAKSREVDAMADALTATQLAVEAVVALLGTVLIGEQVTGIEIKYVVEAIAEEFDCFIAPTSYACAQSRYNFGQVGAPKDAKYVSWNNSPLHDFCAEPDDIWAVDVAMTPRDGKKSFSDCVLLMGNERRQFAVVSVNYCNKDPIPRELAGKMAPILQAGWPQRAANHGGAAELYQCIARNLLVPWIYPPVLRPCPRQATSVLLASAKSTQSGVATVLRLTGGTQFPPNTVGGKREVKNKTIHNLLKLRYCRGQGLDFLELYGC